MLQKKKFMNIVLNWKMRNNLLIIFLFSIVLSGCAGVASKGIFEQVSVAFDPRTVGTQVDDSIMQKFISKNTLLDKKYLLAVKTKFLMVEYFLREKLIILRKNLNLPS